MRKIFARKTQTGYDFFKDGKLMASPRNERELEDCLNSENIFENVCQDFLRRVRESGEATEGVPEMKIRQIDAERYYSLRRLSR
jgi:hypothetical protein